MPIRYPEIAPEDDTLPLYLTEVNYLPLADSIKVSTDNFHPRRTIFLDQMCSASHYLRSLLIGHIPIVGQTSWRVVTGA